MTARTAMLAAATLLGMAALGASEAAARCAVLGFSVNDYGKEGPTKDALSLLDKHIAKWTADHGITKYSASKKSVTCNLFLDFGVFDEHTCKAQATVCWSGGEPGQTKPEDAKAKSPAKPAAKSQTKSTSSVSPVPAKAAPAAPQKTPAEAETTAPASGAPAAPAPTRVKPKSA